ncbi:hypothetical protein TNIN_405141 [Trichonephila inaurata madagascariensis]|uniref:Uncharacterized protein n=1 Tax=Trichonephila inaurata madagascariensis TaxID=2747483 RepID=A0A8X7CA51_9ARAC|nr:hypothetical protein TNIN_405141 [Trichonephila inaurata madagascariensis]
MENFVFPKEASSSTTPFDRKNNPLEAMRCVAESIRILYDSAECVEQNIPNISTLKTPQDNFKFPKMKSDLDDIEKKFLHQQYCVVRVFNYFGKLMKMVNSNEIPPTSTYGSYTSIRKITKNEIMTSIYNGLSKMKLLDKNIDELLRQCVRRKNLIIELLNKDLAETNETTTQEEKSENNENIILITEQFTVKSCDEIERIRRFLLFEVEHINAMVNEFHSTTATLNLGSK